MSRVLLVTGGGGVGKTTLSAALGPEVSSWEEGGFEPSSSLLIRPGDSPRPSA